ncbi:MAG TPA: hypothetical protein VKX46_17600 [Ktedonobacteraceae bacterium]|nr:hypothetical protein [Ktedonobacteraceae bacterium]
MSSRTTKLAMSPHQYSAPATQKTSWLLLLIITGFLAIYMVCLYAIIIPLSRHAIYALPFTNGTSNTGVQIVFSPARHLPLPENLHLDKDLTLSFHSTNFWVFIFLIVCMFTLYGVCALLLRHLTNRRSTFFALGLIFVATATAGCICIFTPGLLSEDIYLYANYGRILAIHHANPYFVPPAAFPQDPSYPYVYWKQTVSVYGPIWMLVCGGLAKVAGVRPIGSVLAFRIFAYVLHLLNTLLVYAILRQAGKSTSAIAMGTLLYGLNPLILFESCTDGHNDICMATFVLLGMCFGMLAEKRGQTKFVFFVPALVAFTLAVLVKVTILPIVVLAIVMLIGKRVHMIIGDGNERGQLRRQRLRAAFITLCQASIVCLIVACLFYGPFWLGHPLQAILYSFTSQPPNGHAFNSLLATLQIWNSIHPFPHILLPLLANGLWSAITALLLSLALALGAWRLLHTPTILTLALMTLAPQAAFLLTTNWFLPWYVVVPISLAAMCVPHATDRWGRTLLALTLTFSASAFLSYYFTFVGSFFIHFRPADSWRLALAYAVQFALPVLAGIVFSCLPSSLRRKRSGPVGDTDTVPS